MNNTDRKNEVSTYAKRYKEQKNKLKKIADQATYPIEYNPVKEKGGLFGYFDHKVTGAELNKITETTACCIRKLNETTHNIMKEFDTIYKTFDELDRGYINAILVNLEIAQKASDDANIAIKRVDQQLETQGIIIEKLKKFKEDIENLKHITEIEQIWVDTNALNEMKIRLESFKHFNDIDLLWNNNEQAIAQIKENKKIFNEKLDGIGIKIEEIQEKIVQQIKRIEKAEEYIKKIAKLDHLFDIDSVWNDVNALKEYRSNLKENKHLNEVDMIWERSIANKKNIEKINTNQANDHDTILELKEELLKEIENTKSRNIVISKKLKILYSIAGASWIFSIIILILQLTGTI